ncbi:DUF6993 domain-containing protein [Microbacterium dextranolyticum]|uniref:DUF6993 domain-containing protein n=1 Tax=Microbacterium dextranolyticum TaxID=36806 RepID=A0A9W6HMR1_9MICO|nr:hypothetical protein [Microbacterium dextranolyticum]MBM7462829.1 hypothetical protein [Microbacterium dextranolyticum]GLJ96066.1 hypothetical protein GCM10017591_21290 [Microbacterium dextranolyticum]
MRLLALHPSRFAVACTIGLVAALGVAGCAPTPTPLPAPSTSATPTATPTPTATAPVLVPEGSAADNLPLFREVMNAVAATDARVQGRAYIDALVAAGFPKTAMELTNDQTTVGNPADSIQFSVKWAGECLVGQVGPSTPAPTALVLPLVPGDTCLVGQTRPIDW